MCSMKTQKFHKFSSITWKVLKVQFWNFAHFLCGHWRVCTRSFNFLSLIVSEIAHRSRSIPSKGMELQLYSVQLKLLGHTGLDLCAVRTDWSYNFAWIRHHSASFFEWLPHSFLVSLGTSRISHDEPKSLDKQSKIVHLGCTTPSPHRSRVTDRVKTLRK